MRQYREPSHGSCQSVVRGSEVQSQPRSRIPAANASVASLPAHSAAPTSPALAGAQSGAAAGAGTGSNAPYGATSAHGPVPFSGLSLAPRRGKDGTTMTLFVRNTGSNSNGPSCGDVSRFLSEKDPGPDYGLVPDTHEDSPEESHADVTETVGNAVNAAVETVSGSLPAIHRAAHRPLNIVAGVFFYFILIVVYILFETRQILNIELSLQSYQNDRLISMSSSLTEQLLAKVTSLQKARDSPSASLLDIVVLEEEAKAIDERRLKLMKMVAHQMSYPGPVDDIQFLVEEHVAYEQLVHSVALAEGRWLRDGEALERFYKQHTLAVDDQGRPTNVLVNDFDEFLFNLAVREWKIRRAADLNVSDPSPVSVSPALREVESSITFAEESAARSQLMKELLNRLRTSRVFAMLLLSLLAFLYFRFA